MTARSTQTNGSIIVAVDDDADDVDLLKLLLRKAGVEHSLQFFQAGEEIINWLEQLVEDAANAVRPLLCLLDIKMPVMSGLDVLRWIRGQRVLDPLPVVMLSSSDDPRDIREAAEAGAQCYLSKYPQPSVLRALIEEAERCADGIPAVDCFRMPNNLLLVRARRL